MSIWHNGDFPLDYVNEKGSECLNGYIGIELTEAGEDYLKGRMPVDRRTTQPAGMLHGGASVVFAETLGSWAGAFAVDSERFHVVGLEINASHMRGVPAGGWVYGVATPERLGRSVHVWNIRITDEQDKPVCTSRLTLAVIEKPSEY